MMSLIDFIGGLSGLASLLLGLAFLLSLHNTINQVVKKRHSFSLNTVVMGFCWLVTLYLFIASRR